MSQLEFGSNEWFEKLNENVVFPEKFVFRYNKKFNIIQSSILNFKGKAEDALWSSIQATYISLDSIEETAVINVIEVGSAENYYDILVKLIELWCQ